MKPVHARRTAPLCLTALLAAVAAHGAEVTLQNDSMTDGSSAVIVHGFVAGEKAASWLTSTCDGNLVALQVFWRSPAGIAPASIQESLEVYRAGSFPEPGALALEVLGPVLTDGVVNEWRYTDENNTIPISVPVTNGETIVVAFTFADTPDANFDPSVVRDTDGNTPGRNALYGDIGTGSIMWWNTALLGIGGDWVIRAVVNCSATPSEADVAVTMSADQPGYVAGTPLEYTIGVSNAGPATANVTLVDIFPAAYLSPIWICTPTAGATCPAGGSGNITGAASLPAGGELAFVVSGSVAGGTTGTLANTMTAVVSAPVTDPDAGNNTATLSLEADNDRIFRDGFDDAPAGLVPVAARLSGRR